MKKSTGRPSKCKLPLGPRNFVRNTIKELALALRDSEMAERYRSGETLAEIGYRFAVTREAVRLRLAALGIKAANGGASFRAVLIAKNKHERRAAIREERCMKLFGISVSALIDINGSPRITGLWNNSAFPITDAYLDQRRNARVRGIGWDFNLASWWKVWQDSGKWDQRGRGTGYCMARWGDSGPYSPENVYICTVGQNFADSYLVHSMASRVAKRKRNTPIDTEVTHQGQ